MTSTTLPGPDERPQGAPPAAGGGPRSTLFFCCAPADRVHRTTLARHLAGLFRRRFTPWSEDDIPAGAEHEAAVARALDHATVVVLLVSADLLASTRHQEREMKRALRRHERGEALVIPVILRACAWEHEPFAKLQALPRESGSPAVRIPVLSAPDADVAFTAVAREIQAAVEAFTPASPDTSAHPLGAASPPRSMAVFRALGVGIPLLVGVSLAVWRLAAHSASPTPPPASVATTRSAPDARSPGLAAPASSNAANPGRSPSPDSTDPSPTPASGLPTTGSPASAASVPGSAPLPVSTPPSPSLHGSSSPPPVPPSLSLPLPSPAPSGPSPASSAAERIAASGAATCTGTVCTLRANGAVVRGAHFCLSAPASAAELEDLQPTCSGKQPTPGADVPCIRTGEGATIELKGPVTWRVCP